VLTTPGAPFSRWYANEPPADAVRRGVDRHRVPLPPRRARRVRATSAELRCQGALSHDTPRHMEVQPPAVVIRASNRREGRAVGRTAQRRAGSCPASRPRHPLSILRQARTGVDCPAWSAPVFRRVDRIATQADCAVNRAFRGSASVAPARVKLHSTKKNALRIVHPRLNIGTSLLRS
jgi:hypothetical protein